MDTVYQYRFFMRIYSWNVNGIRAVVRKGDFEKFITQHSPDILCLQETKAQREQAELDLPAYTEYWNSAQKKGYSGTAVFSKVPAVSTALDLPKDIAGRYELADTYGDPNQEGRVIAAEYPSFWLVTVYTPNTKDDLSRLPLRRDGWDPAFLAFVRKLERAKPVVFCGDLNVAHTADDLARPKENEGKKGYTTEERAGFQAFVDAGFVDTLRLFEKGNGHYTWWTNWANARARNIGWRIDYILVSRALVPAVKAAGIHADVMGSDHCPVSVELAV
jgi:exodeoxyribonuclease-3